jgi:hypothetical protein
LAIQNPAPTNKAAGLASSLISLQISLATPLQAGAKRTTKVLTEMMKNFSGE